MSRLHASRGRLFCVFALLSLVACSGQQTPPAEASPASNGPGASVPGDAPAAGDHPAEATDATAPASAPAATAKPESLLSLCNKMCDAVAPKCTKDQLATCRVTCKNYENSPEACDAVTREALECAKNNRDFLFCSNVVPISCAKQFKALGICSATGVAPEPEQKKGLPDGWTRFEVKDAGFAVAMPKGVQEKTEAGIRRWSVAAPSGASYEVSERPAPTEAKLDNRAFLKLSRTLFDHCADKMKLYALIEKTGHTSMQYKVVCPEKTEQQGVMHVVGSKLFVLLLRFPQGAKVDVDPFVYSFETLP